MQLQKENKRLLGNHFLPSQISVVPSFELDYVPKFLLENSHVNSKIASILFMKNDGHRFETRGSGVQGPVVLQGLDHGTRDLSWQKWSYQVHQYIYSFLFPNF